MAGRAAEAGADALLLVTPYYNKPTQAGVVAHCRAVADATDLPVMLYDIPARTGIPFTTETLVTLAEHPRIVAVKDAKGDLWASTKVMAATDLLWFSGADELNLPLLALGAHRRRLRRRATSRASSTPRWSPPSTAATSPRRAASTPR